MGLKTFFIKTTQWEYWPSYLYYLPLFPFFLKKTIAAKSLVYFSATNPGIFYSGNGTESKYQTLMLLPKEYRPKSIFIKKNENLDKVLIECKAENINFPCILKPDIGFRGYMVKKIENEKMFKNYLSTFPFDVILQDFIDYKNEIGVFYYRMPTSQKGKITSITIKKYLKIFGDGQSTLEELILKDSRASLYLDLLKNIQHQNLQKIYPKNEEILLSEIGNHSKGTQFLNGNHLINEKLTALIDKISFQTEGWYYGRLDLKYDNFDDLLNGKNFKIIEINGIISEPTHIYDATHPEASYLEAIETIKQHWLIIDEIAKMNTANNEIKLPTLKEYINNLKFLRNYSKELKRINQINLNF
ncbi:D-alanine--D-alanine ligase [Namhaeicola litoreus]|uniref:D-alanine--D-alanine ligase n=1 Tax=Namhaeicola litoreus TaxID=1052145 RepID=A0ABW3Y1P3_9FLAO